MTDSTACTSVPKADPRRWFSGLAGHLQYDGDVLLRLGSNLGSVRLHGDTLCVPGGGARLSDQMIDMASIMLDDIALISKLLFGLDTKADPLDPKETMGLGHLLFRHSRTAFELVEAARELRNASDVPKGA